ncbi:MAG: CAAX protease [Helicobacter sp.]|nr:CAAX protease [Helicobacter sp.]
MGNFSLDFIGLQNIKTLFAYYPALLTHDFENRMRQSIRVLHYQYLYGACEEAQTILPKYPTDNLFDTIMKLYNKRRKRHLAGFLLLHCFENALRSTLAVEIAHLYNHDADDWFLKKQGRNAKENQLLRQVATILAKRQLEISAPQNTFDVFDLFSLWDLQKITEAHWNKLAPLFTSEKSYKNQPIPRYKTQEHLIGTINKIRHARNEIFHNKPTQIKFQNDVENLLLRLGYNLQDAIDIGEIRNVIPLQYNYDSESTPSPE